MNSSEKEYKCRLRIENPLGFHVRPVQRFAELAQIFKAEITVEIDGREASGKSVMGLMSLGGRCGATMIIKTKGQDAPQAMNLLKLLVQEDFFVEDDIQPGERENRHQERLKKFASCFDSDILLVLNGQKLPVNSNENPQELSFEPTDKIDFDIEGNDAPQARQALKKLVDYSFYIEDEMNKNSS